MNTLAKMVEAQLLTAIDNDDLVLPTLPEVALSIREAAEDSEISVSTLSKVIRRDAALSARLIKVVNSPLLRAACEVTDLQAAITRLGINYSCNLAIGLVIEQIFHARSEVVEQKMREIWAKAWRLQASAMKSAYVSPTSSLIRAPSPAWFTKSACCPFSPTPKNTTNCCPIRYA